MKTFAQLFAGRTDCYGTYHITKTRSSDGKLDGKGITYSNPGTLVTEQMYSDHLSGKKMLGIVPILPDDNTCSWFALDIDKYDIDQAALGKRIRDLEWPVVHCRSKSGGAHLYCFVEGFIKASLALELAKKWAAILGFPKYDIYPKQDNTSHDSQGNWIILPYFGGDETERYAFGINGEKLTTDEFVQMANAMLVTPDELKKFSQKKAKDNKDDTVAQAPPCAQHFFEHGITEGGRNNALAHMAVFYKKVDPDHWQELVGKFNYDFIDPPLPMEEVQQVIKNASRKDYAYLCNQMPMSGVCDKEACKSRRYGVGPDRTKYGEYNVEEITKIDTDPPIYLVTINGKNVKMSSEDILTPRLFRKRVLEVCNLMIPAFKQGPHDEIIAPLINSAMVIEQAPEEASLDGQVVSVFREWCKNLIWRCKTREDITKGLPFYDEEFGTIIFRGEDLNKAFSTHYRKNLAVKDLWGVLRNLMCEAKSTRIKGDVIKAWHYPLVGEDIWFRKPGDDKF